MPRPCSTAMQERCPYLPVRSNSHCALVQIEIGQDQTVRWMVIGMGTENDLHTPIFFNQVRASSEAYLSLTLCGRRLTLRGKQFYITRSILHT